MSENPIDFCIHLARAVAQGRKTVTYKPLSQTEIRLGEEGKNVRCPYGTAGDTLWVREPYGLVGDKVVYRADYAADGWDGKVLVPDNVEIQSTAMVRAQARTVLTVQSIDIVNLQTVDEVAAHAAGTIPSYGRTTYLDEFKAQWDYSYVRIPWASDPVVWCVTFTKNTPTVSTRRHAHDLRTEKL